MPLSRRSLPAPRLLLNGAACRSKRRTALCCARRTRWATHLWFTSYVPGAHHDGVCCYDIVEGVFSQTLCSSVVGGCQDDIDEFLGSCGVPYDGVIAQITQMLKCVHRLCLCLPLCTVSPPPSTSHPWPFCASLRAQQVPRT